MEGTETASPGNGEVESRPPKESPTTVATGFDSSSLPSPSTSNPCASPEIPLVLDADDYNSEFNDDAMEEIEKSMAALVGGMVYGGFLRNSPTGVTSSYVLSPASSTELVYDACSDDYDGCSEDDECSNNNYEVMEGIKTPMGPIVDGKEPLSALADEYKSGSPIMLQKIKLLGEKYAALRRTRGDGNCFYRSFMFSYLEHILVTQDRAEVERVLVEIEQCRLDLYHLGYAEFTYEDFFNSFTDLLQNCLQGSEDSLSLKELLEMACDSTTSDCVVMFLRFVASAAIQKHAEFFEPFISGMSATSVVQFCKKSVEPMGEESDQVHIIAVCNALGVPIRVVYLDRSSRDPENPSANHHDFFPSDNNNGSNNSSAANVSLDKENPDPFVTLIYRPGHYDILYPI